VGLLRAGLGKHTITPPLGIPLFGYIARTHGAQSVHDDLEAKALVLDDGETKWVLVSCDLLMLHPTTVAAIREGVKQATGIPAAQVMVCCAHTHSGPITFPPADHPHLAGRVNAYLDGLVSGTVSAVTRADRSLRPALWGIGRGKTVIGVNRRQPLDDGRTVIGHNENGPIDPELLVLRIDTVADGVRAPLALLVNYACHAVCLGPESLAVSADWPGVMRRHVEAVGAGEMLFVQGACADVNPLLGPSPSFDGAERLGRQIAEQVLALCKGISLTDQVDLRAGRRAIELPLLGPVGRDGAPVGAFAERIAGVLNLPEDEALAQVDARFPWAADVVERDGVWWVQAEVQALLLGDIALVGVAAEPFVAIGLRAKARSSAAVTFFAGYTNGCVGYVPTPLAYDQCGYEVTESYLFYRLPAPVAPACADLLTGGALTLIDDLL
jgi:neutral ceramidase